MNIDRNTLFVDPVTGEEVSYNQLRSTLGQSELDYAPFVQPATPGEAVSAVLTAMILGQALTLLDSDMGAEELAALGVPKTNLAIRIRIAGMFCRDSMSLSDHARQQTGFRLTLFTSGSTGLPKQVSHDLAGLTRILKESKSHTANVWGLAYNPTHMAGVQVILQAFFNGNPLIHLFPASREVIVEAINKFQITHLSATQSFYNLLLPLDSPIPGVRAVSLGGECATLALVERLHGAFPQARVHNIYASTEAGALLVSDGDVFSIPPSVAHQVMVKQGRLHIHVSLLGQFGGVDQGGRGDWYDTGDVIEWVDADSPQFRIVARERDLVNVGGQKVNPVEVEQVMERYPGVVKVRVSGRRNSVMGQILQAEITCEGQQSTEKEMRAFAAQHLQPIKVPRLIRFVDTIALTRSGKVLRREGSKAEESRKEES